MSYKILTKNGIDNSNIDGARGEYFNTGMRDGIVQGVLNEGTFVASSSNVISLDTCELRICGHRVVIDEPVYHTFTNAPSTDTRYAFVAQIIVDDNQNVDFSLFVQTASTPLIQNDLYKNITGAGTYQVEIGSFTLLTTLTIENVARTIEIITGGTEKDNCPVIELVGTEDNPINFWAMELGKLYICTGVYNTRVHSFIPVTSHIAGKTVTFNATQPLLIFKRTPVNVTIFNAIARLDNGTNVIIGQYPYGLVNIAFIGGGLLVDVYNGRILQDINGEANWANYEDVEAGIYVPTTSGTSGQILQSNGENAAPTWLTPSSMISNSSTASEIPSAQAVYNYVDDVVGDIETALSEV